MIQPIPAPGYALISGNRNPPDGEGVKYWVQLRSGWVDELSPWPVKGMAWRGKTGPRWKWGSRPDCADIVAVRKA